MPTQQVKNPAALHTASNSALEILLLRAVVSSKRYYLRWKTKRKKKNHLNSRVSRTRYVRPKQDTTHSQLQIGGKKARVINQPVPSFISSSTYEPTNHLHPTTRFQPITWFQPINQFHPTYHFHPIDFTQPTDRCLPIILWTHQHRDAHTRRRENRHTHDSRGKKTKSPIKKTTTVRRGCRPK